MNDIKEELTVGTFIMNGASNFEKLKDTFVFLRRTCLDIILLQETHWKTESENYIRAIWGYNCFVCLSIYLFMCLCARFFDTDLHSIQK